MLHKPSVRRWVLTGGLMSLLVGTAPLSAAPVVNEKRIMGWLETVFLRPQNLKLTAKLDSGAKTSSVSAERIEHFTRNGEAWVRFDFVADKQSDPIKIERPLVRKAVIKERLSASSTREVVLLSICKNGITYDTEFTLNDRSNFNYPMLLGRSFLADVALIDSGSTFLFKAENDPCAQKDKPAPSH